MNSRTKDEIIKLVNVDGKQALWYKVPQISVALLRATTADTVGNVSFEREVFQADALNQACAALQKRTCLSRATLIEAPFLSEHRSKSFRVICANPRHSFAVIAHQNSILRIWETGLQF